MDSAWAYSDLALIAATAGRYAEARTDASLALKSDPSSPNAVRALVGLEALLGHDEAAFADASRVQTLLSGQGAHELSDDALRDYPKLSVVGIALAGSVISRRR